MMEVERIVLLQNSVRVSINKAISSIQKAIARAREKEDYEIARLLLEALTELLDALKEDREMTREVRDLVERLKVLYFYLGRDE